VILLLGRLLGARRYETFLEVKGNGMGIDWGSCHGLIRAFQIVLAMTRGFKSSNDVRSVDGYL
jgi:hypothetical protein